MSTNFDEKSYASALTLSVSVDLVSAVVSKVVGNDVSSTVNGQKATDAMIETIAANRIIDNLTKKK